ncbi:hypothetical protein OHR68_20255 [Spirillospora sp. NBC_00431]
MRAYIAGFGGSDAEIDQWVQAHARLAIVPADQTLRDHPDRAPAKQCRQGRSRTVTDTPKAVGSKADVIARWTRHRRVVLFRDSKDPTGPFLVPDPETCQALSDRIKQGHPDLH